MKKEDGHRPSSMFPLAYLSVGTTLSWKGDSVTDAPRAQRGPGDYRLTSDYSLKSLGVLGAYVLGARRALRTAHVT